jgi:peptide/nickel transport system substrate-binding protein
MMSTHPRRRIESVGDRDALELRRLIETQLSRRRFLGVTGAAAVTGIAAACGATTSSSGPTQQPGTTGAPAPTSATGVKPSVDTNTLVVADVTTPQSLDYDQSEALQAQEANANLHAGWLEFARKGNPAGYNEPDVKQIIGILAESFSSSSDGLTHTVKLRQGLMSNVGNELTTDDIIYMFDRHFATKTTGEFQVRVAGIEKTDQIKVLDRYNFEVHLPTFNSIFWDALVPALATNVWDSVEAKKHATSDDPWSLKWMAVNAAGWGAYTLEKLDAGREMIYRANPKFMQGVPKIDKIIYRIVPESANRLALLQAGEIDVAKDLSPRELDQARSDPNLQVVDVTPGNIWVTLFYNNGEEPFSGNPDVRRALSAAIPYDDILKTVYFNKASRLKGPMAEIGQDFSQASWDKYGPQTNIDQAKKYLADGGYPNGFKTSLAYNADEPETEQISVLLKSAWAQIGVEAELNRVPSAAFAEGKNKHSYPIALEKNYLIVNRGGYEIPLMFTPGSPINWANYEADDYGSFPFWDAVQAAVAEMDPAKALQDWAAIQDHLIDTAVEGWAAAPGFHLATKRGLTGFTWDTDNQIRWRFLSWG